MLLKVLFSEYKFVICRMSVQCLPILSGYKIVKKVFCKCNMKYLIGLLVISNIFLHIHDNLPLRVQIFTLKLNSFCRILKKLCAA
jgi:hypothetical protein